MSAVGALIGLALAIALILRKISPVYALMLGALVGGLCGGMSLPATVSAMIYGVNDITSAVLRILAAGVLTGVLVVTGAAESISNTIVSRLGEKHVHLSLALATMLLTAIGVFIDVAVITVAPIALTVASRLRLSRSSVLLMMIGGGKCGNIISPNPNTIICAENFNVDLYSVMCANLLPALLGLAFTVWVVGRMVKRREDVVSDTTTANAGWHSGEIPSFTGAMAGPAFSIILLALRPIAGVSIDPLVALPAGGLVGIVAMRRLKLLGKCLRYGLEKMTGVAVLLIGTGTIAGIIKASTIKDLLLGILSEAGISDALMAPAAGILMSAATASTTAGATIASSSFADVILASGVSGMWGAAMINAGSTVLDHLPHGSFFHATGGVAELSIATRMRLIPYETSIGVVLTLASTAACCIWGR